MNVRARLLPALGFASVGLCFAAAPARAEAPKAEPYTLTVSAPAGKAGQEGVAKIEVKPASGYHFNKDYPTVLTLTAPAGVTAPAKMTKKDAGVKVEEAGASFDVKYKADAAGKKEVKGTLSFAVCTEKTCDPRKAPVTISLDVK